MGVTLIRPSGPVLFSERPLPQGERTALDGWWSAFSVDRPFLYNGDLIACASCETDARGKLEIGWYRTTYAHYLQRLTRSPVLPAARALFCSVVLVTQDGRLVVGQMSDETASPRRLQLPGGNITGQGSAPLTVDHCAAEAARELQEELGFDAEPGSLSLWRVKVGGAFGDVGLMFSYRMPVPAALVRSTFGRHCSDIRSRGSKPEFRELQLIDPGRTAAAQSAEPQVDYLEGVLAALKEPGSR